MRFVRPLQTAYRRMRPLAAPACALLTLAGCAPKPGAARRASPGTAVLRYPLIEEPPTLDPARVQDVYLNELVQNVFEGLVAFDAHNRPAPLLAEKWETSADGLTWTFHLRRGVHFHNGRELTSADFKWSLERALQPATHSPTAANYLSGIVGAAEAARGARRDVPGIVAANPHTLVIRLENPTSCLLGKLSYPTAWALCREAVEKNGGLVDERSAIGTGPFKLTEYRHGAKVTLEANRDYWGGRPKLDRIDRPIVLDPQTMHVMYENGEVDLMVPALSDFTNDQTNPKLKAESRLLDQANVFYLVMHPRLQPVFKDARVRRAFAMVIDKDELSRVAYRGTSPRADTFLPSGLAGSNPNPHRIPLDPEGARRLLAEAGFPDGKGFPQLTLVSLEHQPEWNAMAQLIRDSLKRELGITIALSEHETATFWSDTSYREKIPFYITGWVADYLDSQDFLSTLLRTGAPLNHIAYSNPKFDLLCDKADREPDPAKRASLYRQADQIAMDDVAVIPLIFYRQPLMVKPYVKGIESNLALFLLPHTGTRIERTLR